MTNRLTFHKITYQNIFSFGKEPHTVVLDSHPTTLLLGHNGSGKSSGISDVLAFALYGRAHRDILKGTIPNSINEKNCRVELDFSVGSKKYRIIRGIKPNIFEIHCDGVLLPQGSKVNDYQEYLEKNILRMNFKSFCQIVVLGKAAFTPFMKLSGPERRTIIEDLLDIRVFSLMSDLMKKKVKDLEAEMSTTTQGLSLVEVKIGASERIIAELNVSNDDQIKVHEIEIKRLEESVVPMDTQIVETRPLMIPEEEKIKDIQNDIQEVQRLIVDKKAKIEVVRSETLVLNTKLSEKKKIQDQIRTFDDLKIKIMTNRDLKKKNLDFFRINDVCPTCTQDISETKKAEKIQEGETEDKKFEEGLVGLGLEVEKLNVRLKEFIVIEENIKKLTNEGSVLFSELQVLQSSVSCKESDIAEHNRKIMALKHKISLLEAEKTSTNNQIIRYQAAIGQLKLPKGSVVDEITKLDLAKSEKGKLLDDRAAQLTKKQYYDIATLLLKDTGIKTRVIKQYLPIMNKLINKYLTEMDFFVNFEINENFEETIKSRYRDEFKYANFSEGQKQRLDLALLWTWREIGKMRNGVSTNLIVFDEILDSSLDGAGVDDFMRIIKSQEDINIFVISHHSEDMAPYFSRTFRFSLKNNFSVVEEL